MSWMSDREFSVILGLRIRRESLSYAPRGRATRSRLPRRFGSIRNNFRRGTGAPRRRISPPKWALLLNNVFNGPASIDMDRLNFQ